MWNAIKHLDRLLRGQVTSVEELRKDQLDLPVAALSLVIIVLGMIYGACMGLFSVTGSGNGAPMQIPAAMAKVPALFFFTLLVTFPSLYVFNALVGSRLSFTAILRLLVASLAIILAVLASLGPIVAFFSISTTSYRFMLLLNVCIYAVSGLLGLTFLLQTLHRITIAQTPPSPPPPLPVEPVDPESDVPVRQIGALDKLHGHVLGPHVKTVFRIWIFVFGLVGTQMAWVLRPFVGNPNTPFTWFRPRESNFFETVWTLIFGTWSGR